MKKLLGILFVLGTLSSNTFAAVFNEHYSCGITHAHGNKYPIPDAPIYSLNCTVQVGIAFGGALIRNCEAYTTNFMLGNHHTTTKLTLDSQTKSMVVFKAKDIVVHMNTKKHTAEIQIGKTFETACALEKAE